MDAHNINSERDEPSELDLVYERLLQETVRAEAFKKAAEGLVLTLTNVFAALEMIFPELADHPNIVRSKQLVSNIRVDLREAGNGAHR